MKHSSITACPAIRRCAVKIPLARLEKGCPRESAVETVECHEGGQCASCCHLKNPSIAVCPAESSRAIKIAITRKHQTRSGVRTVSTIERYQGCESPICVH